MPRFRSRSRSRPHLCRPPSRPPPIALIQYMEKRHREETEKKIEDAIKKNQQVLERWWIAQYEQSELQQQRCNILRDLQCSGNVGGFRRGFMVTVSVVAFQS